MLLLPDSYILMPYAQGIQKSDDVRDTVNIESLLTTSDSAYSKTDLNSGSLEKEGGDVDGPFDLGVSITETVDDDKETHIFIIPHQTCCRARSIRWFLVEMRNL